MYNNSKTMELSEIIMRCLYLVVLFLLLNAVLRATTPLLGNALLSISFFGAVLILYATFDYVYDFLLNNELIFQIKNSQEDEEDDQNNNQQLGSSTTEITNELNVDNKKNVYDSNKVNHTHKYIVNKVFE